MTGDKFSGSVRLRKTLVKDIDEYVNSDEGKRKGYKTRADFINKAILELIQKEDVTHLSHINVRDALILVKDDRQGDYAAILLVDNRVWCDKCNSETCIHVQYALSLPETVEKLKEKGWKNKNG